jgi:hypothetical protein
LRWRSGVQGGERRNRRVLLADELVELVEGDAPAAHDCADAQRLEAVLALGGRLDVAHDVAQDLEPAARLAATERQAIGGGAALELVRERGEPLGNRPDEGRRKGGGQKSGRGHRGVPFLAQGRP